LCLWVTACSWRAVDTKVAWRPESVEFERVKYNEHNYARTRLRCKVKDIVEVAGSKAYGIAGLVSILADGDATAQRGLDDFDEVPVAQNCRC
jgi:hypothetical protein